MTLGDVVVLIPTHSRFDLLAQAVDSVSPLPFIIVDDSPKGMLPDSFINRALCVIRTTGEEGFSSAVNQGLLAAKDAGFPWVLLLNDDAILEPGSIERLSKARSSDVGVLAPVLIDQQGRESFGVKIHSWGRVHRRNKPPIISDPEAVSGACMLIRNEERFDTAFRHGMEDFELCMRVRARGQRIVVVPDAFCRHIGGGTVPQNSRSAQRHGLSGQLRLVGGGWKSPLVLGLAFAQIIRERGPRDRLIGIWDGWNDWCRER